MRIHGSEIVVVLTHLSGAQAGQCEILDQDRIRLGRAFDNDVIFTAQDLRTSAHHGEISLEEDEFTIQDLESTNGTYVDGARVERSSLRNGSIVQLGRKGPQLLFELKPKDAVGQLHDKPWTKGTTISQSAQLRVDPAHHPPPGGSRRIGLQTMQLAIDTAVHRSSSTWRRIVAVVVFVALTAAATAVYVVSIRPGTGAPGMTDSAHLFAAVARRNQPAVVLIQLDFSIVDTQGEVLSEGRNEGTGFAFDARGFIATNYHIIRPWEYDGELKNVDGRVEVKSLTVVFADHKASEAVPATILQGSKEYDVVILAIPPPPHMPLIEGLESRVDAIQQGDEVAFIGFPYGSDLLSTTRQDRATTTLKRTIVSKVTPDLIQLDSSIQTGFSGSPIFNRDGNVIGLVTAEIKDDIESRSLSIGLGTPIQHVLALLGEG